MDVNKIPKYAKGDVLPDGIAYALFLEEKAKFEQKKRDLHDYKVAITSALVGASFGAIFGFVASLLVIKLG